jgi:hypothetical protein
MSLQVPHLLFKILFLSKVIAPVNRLLLGYLGSNYAALQSQDNCAA